MLKNKISYKLETKERRDKLNNFTKYLEKAIDKYLEDVDFDLEDIDSSDIISSIDTRDLAKEIANSIEDRILTFTPMPRLDTNYSVACPGCNKIVGTWNSQSGVEVSDYHLCQTDKKIFILDDF